jgi:hypothetical protein
MNLGTSGSSILKLYNLYSGARGLEAGRVVENLMMFGFAPYISSFTSEPKGLFKPICSALGLEPMMSSLLF